MLDSHEFLLEIPEDGEAALGAPPPGNDIVFSNGAPFETLCRCVLDFGGIETGAGLGEPWPCGLGAVLSSFPGRGEEGGRGDVDGLLVWSATTGQLLSSRLIMGNIEFCHADGDGNAIVSQHTFRIATTVTVFGHPAHVHSMHVLHRCLFPR